MDVYLHCKILNHNRNYIIYKKVRYNFCVSCGYGLEKIPDEYVEIIKAQFKGLRTWRKDVKT